MKHEARCRQCGRLKPHFAQGRAEQGFEYKDSGRCLACRLGTRGAQIQPEGRDALKNELVRLNSRRGVKRG